MRLIDAEELGSMETRVDQKLIDEAPTIDALPKGVVDTFKWERDTAIAQLEEYGISFAEKKRDFVEVVRCKDCKHWHNTEPLCTLYIGSRFAGENDYCSYGERKDDEDR